MSRARVSVRGSCILRERAGAKMRVRALPLNGGLRLVTRAARRGRAVLWRQYYFARYHVRCWTTRNATAIATVLLVILTAAAFASIPTVQRAVNPLFASDDHLAT